MTLERNDDIRLSEEEAAQAGLAPDEPMSDEEQVEVAEIRAEIEETRLEMGGTLNELGDRLEPSHLVEQARENVREATIGRVEETAKGMSDMVMETIKRNPIPAVLAGAGLAILWANRSQGTNGHRTMQHDTGYGYQSRPASRYGTEQTSEGIGSKAKDVASTVGETAQQATGEVMSRAGQTVEQVGWKADRFMQANPLAMGAIAIGAGALIGSLVPETTQERELLGDASRQVGDTVRDRVDQAATKAEETMDRAEEEVTSPA